VPSGWRRRFGCRDLGVIAVPIDGVPVPIWLRRISTADANPGGACVGPATGPHFDRPCGKDSNHRSCHLVGQPSTERQTERFVAFRFSLRIPAKLLQSWTTASPRES